MPKIYALADPRDGAIRYIGKAIDPHARLRSHVNDKGSTRKCRWIASLREAGLDPSIVILEEVSGCWKEAEMRWIKHYRAAGADLCNHTEGGEGLNNPSPETREKLSKLRRDDWKNRREEMLERIRSPERCEKISRTLTGRPKDPRHVAKLPQNQTRMTAKKLEKMARPKGRQSWPATQTPESNRKRSETLKGRPKSEEFKRKAREAALRRWAKERSER